MIQPSRGGRKRRPNPGHLDASSGLLLTPIGHVHAPREFPPSPDDARRLESEIILLPGFEEGLVGIEAYRHLIVVFLLHEASGYRLLHRLSDLEESATGVFACRCPNRPNRIAVTVVDQLGRVENRLRVRGLDAFDGSPVLDLKPYLPQRDVPLEPGNPCLPHAPDWARGAA